MCLIVVAKKGTEKYSDFFLNAIRVASITNIDGIGYSFKKNGQDKVWISKGFKDVDKFIKTLKQKHLKDEDELIVHLRIGNKGAKTTDMNHPFVISEDSDTIISNDSYIKLPIMCHNGTFFDYSIHNSPLSDTFFFIKDFMSIPEILSLLKRDSVKFSFIMKEILKLNRLAFIFNDNTPIITIGKFEEDQGYLFSNESYKIRGLVNIGGVNRHTEDYEGYDEYYEGMRNRPQHRQSTIPFRGPASSFNLPILAGDDRELTPGQDRIDNILRNGKSLGCRIRDEKGMITASEKIDIIPPRGRIDLKAIYNTVNKTWLYPTDGKIIYTPIKYMKSQFDFSIFTPALFNYTHFNFWNSLGNQKENISSTHMYRIYDFDSKNPKEEKYSAVHILNTLSFNNTINNMSGITNTIYQTNEDIIENFTSLILPDLRVSYYTVYRLIQKFGTPSKNLYNNISKVIRNAENKNKKENLTYKNTTNLNLLGMKIFCNYVALAMYDYDVAKGIFFKVQEVEEEDKSVDLKTALLALNNSN